MRVLSHTAEPHQTAARDGTPRRVVRPIGHFLMHLLEMCAVMCLGGGLLIVLFFGAAAVLGYSDLRQTAPQISILAIAVCLAGAMVAWMRFRRMAWRPTLEMAGSSVAVGLLMVVSSWLGLASTTALIGVECALACVAMVAVMLFRVRLYSGRTTSDSPAVQP